MAESQITVRLDRALIHRFRVVCLMRETTCTKAITRLVREQVEAWEREGKLPQLATSGQPSNSDGGQ